MSATGARVGCALMSAAWLAGGPAGKMSSAARPAEATFRGGEPKPNDGILKHSDDTSDPPLPSSLRGGKWGASASRAPRQPSTESPSPELDAGREHACTWSMAAGAEPPELDAGREHACIWSTATEANLPELDPGREHACSSSSVGEALSSLKADASGRRAPSAEDNSAAPRGISCKLPAGLKSESFQEKNPECLVRVC